MFGRYLNVNRFSASSKCAGAVAIFRQGYPILALLIESKPSYLQEGGRLRVFLHSSIQLGGSNGL